MFRFPLSILTVFPATLFLTSTALAQEAEVAAEVEAEPTPEEAAEPVVAEPVAVEEAPAEPAAEPIEEPVPVEAAPVATAEPPPAPVEEAPAPSLLPIDVGTDVWSRFEIRNGYDGLGVSRTRFQEGDQTVFRARLTLQTAPLQLTDDITGSVYFAPQASGLWGTSGGGGTIGEANLGIYEGYFKLSSSMMEGKVGRFAMNYGEALIIGNLDWHQSGRAFDGVHLRFKPGAVNIDAFVTQQTEGWPAPEPFMAGDNYFWGLYGQFGKAIAEGLDLDAYLLGSSAAATDVQVADGMGGMMAVHKDAATFLTFGARAKQSFGMFDYRAEAGLQFGKQVGPATDNVSKFAYQADLEAGFTFAPGTRLAINGAIASGNDPTSDTNGAWDELFPTTHKWFGLMDVIGFRTNILSANVKFNTKFTESLGFAVHGHVFSRLEQPALGYVGDENLAGYEVNAMLKQNIGKYAFLHGLFGVFIPNSNHYATATTAQYGEAQAGLHF